MPGRGHLIAGMSTGSVFVWHGGKMYAKEDKSYGGRGGGSPPQYLSFLSRAACKKNKRQRHTISNTNRQRPGNVAFKGVKQHNGGKKGNIDQGPPVPPASKAITHKCEEDGGNNRADNKKGSLPIQAIGDHQQIWNKQEEPGNAGWEHPVPLREGARLIIRPCPGQ